MLKFFTIRALTYLDLCQFTTFGISTYNVYVNVTIKKIKFARIVITTVLQQNSCTNTLSRCSNILKDKIQI